jgi:hypothetical protein
MRNYSTLNSLINKFDQDAENFELDAETEELLISMDIEDFMPQQSSVNNILNFARSFEVLESNIAGMIEMNLN